MLHRSTAERLLPRALARDQRAHRRRRRPDRQHLGTRTHVRHDGRHARVGQQLGERRLRGAGTLEFHERAAELRPVAPRGGAVELDRRDAGPVKRARERRLDDRSAADLGIADDEGGGRDAAGDRRPRRDGVERALARIDGFTSERTCSRIRVELPCRACEQLEKVGEGSIRRRGGTRSPVRGGANSVIRVSGGHRRCARASLRLPRPPCGQSTTCRHQR